MHDFAIDIDLLDKNLNVGRLALFDQVNHPRNLAWPTVRAGLATDDYEINAMNMKFS